MRACAYADAAIREESFGVGMVLERHMLASCISRWYLEKPISRLVAIA